MVVIVEVAASTPLLIGSEALNGNATEAYPSNVFPDGDASTAAGRSYLFDFEEE